MADLFFTTIYSALINSRNVLELLVFFLKNAYEIVIETFLFIKDILKTN